MDAAEAKIEEKVGCEREGEREEGESCSCAVMQGGHGSAGELAFPRLCDAARLASYCTMLRDRSTICNNLETEAGRIWTNRLHSSSWCIRHTSQYRLRDILCKK
jgi:hypothetical protein